MKKFNLKLSIIILIVLFFTLSAKTYSQTTETEVKGKIAFIFNKKDGKIFTVTKDNERYAEFIVTGLKTKEEIEKFTKKINDYRGVIDFSVLSEIEDNKRKAKGTFYKFATINKEYWNDFSRMNNVDIIIKK